MTTSEERVPLLSVGLPVYNGMPYLIESIESILNQDFRDLEVVATDNASSDETEEVLRGYAERDPRVRYIRNPKNLGASRNYIRCFELARGKYFRWGAADDYITPGAMGACVEVLESDPTVVLAWPQTRIVGPEGEFIEDYDDGGDGWAAETPADRFWASLAQWGYCNVAFGVMRRDVLAETVLFGDYPASDLVWQSDMAIRGRFKQVRGHYYHRRVHDRITDALSEEELAAFYLPDSDQKFHAKRLNMFRELAGVVRRAPVSAAEKARMFRMLARKARWTWGELSAELKGLAART
jgi:glycosyltransferase involved in cell wall biosynthesis